MTSLAQFARFLVKIRAILFVLGLASITLPAVAGTEVNTGYFGQIAIKGYDPVAYFVRGKAMRGSEEHRHEWLGAYWHFSSAENKEAFKTSPFKFAPQFGGHCSAGVSGGTLTSDIDPEAWKIIDGKLYLNYSKSVNRRFDSNRARKAAANWEKLKVKAAQK